MGSHGMDALVQNVIQVSNWGCVLGVEQRGACVDRYDHDLCDQRRPVTDDGDAAGLRWGTGRARDWTTVKNDARLHQKNERGNAT